MTDRLLCFLIALSALGCGLSGGVFFAFSNFVMSGLARLPAPQGVNAMNSINVTVVNPSFMLVLFGTGAWSVVVCALAIFRGPDARTPWLLVGSVLYLGGVVVVTIVCNVPRNSALATLTPGDSALTQAWTSYLRGWLLWNHVRTAAGLSAAASFLLALCKGPT